MTSTLIQSILLSHPSVRDLQQRERGFSFRINSSPGELIHSSGSLWILKLQRGDSQTVSESSLQHHLDIFARVAN